MSLLSPPLTLPTPHELIHVGTGTLPPERRGFAVGGSCSTSVERFVPQALFTVRV